MLYNLQLLKTEDLHKLFLKISEQFLEETNTSVVHKKAKEKHDELSSILQELGARKIQSQETKPRDH